MAAPLMRTTSIICQRCCRLGSDDHGRWIVMDDERWSARAAASGGIRQHGRWRSLAGAGGSGRRMRAAQASGIVGTSGRRCRRRAGGVGIRAGCNQRRSARARVADEMGGLDHPIQAPACGDVGADRFGEK
ncbi:hypothetical protein ACLOJK_021157 [Asimina triloba]